MRRRRDSRVQVGPWENLVRWAQLSTAGAFYVDVYFERFIDSALGGAGDYSGFQVQTGGVWRSPTNYGFDVNGKITFTFAVAPNALDSWRITAPLPCQFAGGGGIVKVPQTGTVEDIP